MTEERKIQLIAEVDATGTRAGFNEIQRQAGTMADSVQRSSQQAERSVAGVGNGAGSSARNVEAAQRNLIGSIQRTTAAMEAGSRSGSAYYEVLARQRGVDPAVLAPYLAQLRAVEAAQTRASAANVRGAASLDSMGMSAGQTRAALQGIPAQVTDIITSLQGGQAPLTVLLQQGGQLSDMFGGIGNAARALGGYVRGLVTPYTVAAAAAVGLAVAYRAGSKEADEYARSLALTGNAAGGTVDQLSEMAREIGMISGSRGAAAAAVAAIAGTGQVSSDNLQKFAAVAVEAQKVIGRSVADTAADFDALKDAPLTALDRINGKYHFITAATYAQVKALQDQGRASEAAAVAQNAYADAVLGQKDRVLDTLSNWERGWIRIKNGISGAIDSTLDIGRVATNFEKINQLLQRREAIEIYIARARAERNTKNEDLGRANLDQNEKDINAIRKKGDVEKSTAKATADAADVAEAKNKWLLEGDKYLSRAAQLERDITKARNEGAAANLSSADIEKRLGDIRKKYADIYNDGVDSSIEALKRRAAVEDELTQRTIASIAARRNIGGITEEQAINQTADAEDKAFARRLASLEKEKTLLKDKQNSRKDQEAKQGEIDLMLERRTSAQIKREQDLAALTEARLRRSIDLQSAGIGNASAELSGYVESARVQREYNEEIGLTGEELIALREQRSNTIAGLKEETAAALEAIEPGSKLAKIYRDQASAIRDNAGATRDGFTKQRDPWTILTASAKRYGEEASNIGALVGDALSNGFRGAEEAFASFVTSGKLDFKSLANSIIADMARISAKQALSPLYSMAASALGGMFGGTGNPGASADGFVRWDQLAPRANGGPVAGGTSYLVGERGPEVFTPSSSGRIIANHQIGGSGGDINISTNVSVSAGGATSQTSGDSNATGRALAEMINVKVKEVLVRETRQGGILWNQQMRGAA